MYCTCCIEIDLWVLDQCSGLYVLDQRKDNQYKMFNLKNHEFTCTVDDTEIHCGLNGALYSNYWYDADGGAGRCKLTCRN